MPRINVDKAKAGVRKYIRGSVCAELQKGNLGPGRDFRYNVDFGTVIAVLNYDL